MSNWRRHVETVFGAATYLVLIIGLPLLVLTSAGIVYLYQNNSLLQLLLGWLALSLLAYGVYAFTRRSSRSKAATDSELDQLPEQLAARGDWSTSDTELWQRCCATIEAQIAADLPWPQLQASAIALLGQVADNYHSSSANPNWRFTLPEGLLIVEETARRYRALVDANLPYADELTVAALLSLYQRQNQLRTGVSWFNWARRAVRLINPASAALGELRDQVTGRVFDEVNTSVQVGLKRMLLQEVVQVGIDLYSGRLRVTDDRLAEYVSDPATADLDRHVLPPEPLRVVLLGQISSGKSSLVNALIGELQAEADVLPTTDRATVHQLLTPDGYQLHLIDLPGVDTTGGNLDELAVHALQADLLVWVVKANQPGRAGIMQLIERVRADYAADPQRRAPPQMLVLTHVDRLPPLDDWAPPYNLNSAVPKALSIRRALDHVLAELGFTDDMVAVPVCLANEVGDYNVSAVSTQLMASAESAQQAQRNRRRIELARQPTNWRTRARQFRGLGLALGKAVFDKRTDEGTEER